MTEDGRPPTADGRPPFSFQRENKKRRPS